MYSRARVADVTRDEGTIVEMASQIATFGLSQVRERFPVCPADQWPALHRYLVAQRLTGIALASMDANELLLEPAQERLLHTSHRDALMSSLRIERVLLDLTERFDAVGIEPIVLKGTALANSIYPAPSWRTFADVDMLVRTTDWGAARDVVAAAGAQRRTPEPRPHFDERFGKAATFLTEDGIEIDLHRTLAPGPFGLWLDVEELSGRTIPFRIGGRFLRRLDNEAAFAHACLHASLNRGGPRLVPLRDALQILDNFDLDWDVLGRWASTWKLGPVFKRTLDELVTRFGWNLPSGTQSIRNRSSRRSEERALDAYVTTRRWRGGTPIATLSAIRGFRARGAYVMALMLPQRQFLAARAGLERGSYVQRWMVPVQWLSRRA